MRNVSFQRKLSPAQILIWLDSKQSNDMAGRLYSGYYHRVYNFSNVTELMLAIDRLCDAMQFPQATSQNRSFESKHMKTFVRKVENFMDSEIETVCKPENATFLVHIKFRQNASWQGSITWVEKEKTQNFRSALEMLKLMDEARQPAVAETIGWDDNP
ncbi:MAG: Type II toxin-antitoxin system HicB family antitoxin [Oscillospiraceae bacterium]|jgi:hypothetical protein